VKEFHITQNGKSIKVGEIHFDLIYTFIKYVKYSKHYFNKGNSYGIDLETFEQYLDNKIHIIKFIDTELNATYSISIEEFKKHSFILHFKPYKAQIFSDLKNFTKIKNS